MIKQTQKNNSKYAKNWQRILIASVFTLLLNGCMGQAFKPDADGMLSAEEYAGINVDSDVKADFNEAVSMLQQNKNEQAASILKRVINREKRLPSPYINIAIAYHRLTKIDEAIENINLALKLDALNPMANNELGLLYREKGEFEAARTAYLVAINNHKNYLPAKKNLGVLCDIYINDTACALEQFERYLQEKPNDKKVKIWIADVKNRLAKK
jgi:Tfp pilus assembly protein PilF